MSQNPIGRYAGWLALSEIFLGSTLHSLHIPFSGTFLTFNQIFLLTHSAYQSKKKRFSFDPLLISSVAALLKSLAPSGKKITPMIAIAMQGLLYNLGIALFGNRRPGLLLGAILASAWGTFQSLLIYYVIFGQSLVETISGISKEFSQLITLPENSLYYVLAAFLLLKAIAASFIVLLTPYLPTEKMTVYLRKITRFKPPSPKKEQTPLILALQDLRKPTFLLVLFGITLFDVWKNQNFETLPMEIAKPLLVAFLCFYALRKFPLKQFATNRMTQSQSRFSQALKFAAEEIDNPSINP